MRILTWLLGAGPGWASIQMNFPSSRNEREMNLREDWSFTITEKAPTRQSHLKHYSDTMLEPNQPPYIPFDQ